VLLEALFGEKVAQEIMLAEKLQDGGYPLVSQEELQAILFKHLGTSGSLSVYEPYINFSKLIPTKEKIAGTDSTTGLRMTRKCVQ
jgi:hypothetical protein